MTTTADPGHAAPAPRPAGDGDSADLAGFGYPQQLRRRLGSFASFAAGFSFVSILTTVFQLFAFGFSLGGPAFFWTWPLVFAGQLMVALVFADLAARYPLSGCIYQWSRRLAGNVTGWSAGWLMLVGEIISVAAAAIALQVVLPALWTGFQLVPGDSALTSTSGAANAIVLGALLITVTTLINAIGVRAMALVNNVGVICELTGVVLLVVLLFANAERGPAVVTDTGEPGAGGGYMWAFLASALMAAYVMYGFDSAGELAEETRDPRRTAPRAIVQALAVSGVGGALLLIAGLMAAPSLTDGRLSLEGLPYVLTGALGTGLGKVLLADVAIAVVVCTLAIQTAASRLLFSMARDGALPGSSVLGRVSARTGAPVLPALVVGVLAVALLAVNIGNAQIFTAITGAAIAVVYVAYLLVTVPALIARLRGRLLPAPGGALALGRTGIAVNLLASCYGVGMAINIAWPRATVYDPDGGDPVLRWFPVLVLGGAALVGALVLATRRFRLAVPIAPVAVAVAGSVPASREGSRR
jgi:urea carboxylase system permease